MTIESRVSALATAIGTDVKALYAQDGDLTSLTTTAKTNLVAAINELATAVASATGINDAVTATGSTWSSTKITAEIASGLDGLVNAAPGTLNTLDELAAALNDDPNAVTALQTLAAANQAAVTALSTAVGDTEADYVAVYNAAKA